MTAASLLPPDFADLEGFVGDWAISGSDARKKRRIASTAGERVRFYEAAAPRLSSALAYLDRFDIDALDAPCASLMDLMLMLGHVSLAVEKQGDNEERHAVNHAHFTITRSTEDY
jgi:hypothetical protein